MALDALLLQARADAEKRFLKVAVGSGAELLPARQALAAALEGRYVKAVAHNSARSAASCTALLERLWLGAAPPAGVGVGTKLRTLRHRHRKQHNAEGGGAGSPLSVSTGGLGSKGPAAAAAAEAEQAQLRVIYPSQAEPPSPRAGSPAATRGANGTGGGGGGEARAQSMAEAVQALSADLQLLRQAYEQVATGPSREAVFHALVAVEKAPRAYHMLALMQVGRGLPTPLRSQHTLTAAARGHSSRTR
jgi:hypothetical protein